MYIQYIQYCAYWCNVERAHRVIIMSWLVHIIYDHGQWIIRPGNEELGTVLKTS